MGFLWSEIELDFSSHSFRYYNDLVWYSYSIISFFPLVLLTFYKLVTQI